MTRLLEILGKIIAAGLFAGIVMLWVNHKNSSENQFHHKPKKAVVHAKNSIHNISKLKENFSRDDSINKHYGSNSSKSGKNSINNYWNNFDFTADNLISNPELLKQPGLTFLQLLERYPDEKESAVISMMNKMLAADTVIIKYMVDKILEKYLYNPASPMRNEVTYLYVIKGLLKSNRINQQNKTRFEFQQKLLKQNQIGNVANNFDFIALNGERGELYNLETEYLLIYFNNPECNSCKTVSSLFTNSDVLNQLISSGQVKMLSVYPDNYQEAWRKSYMPKNWINVFNQSQSILNYNLYDLRAIPSLYLLDKDKRVIIKDGSPEKIIRYLIDIILMEGKRNPK